MQPPPPAPKGRCSSCRRRSLSTTSRSPRAGPTRRAPTTRPTRSTRRHATSRANGARDGADLSAAVFDYNHSESYVAEVLDLANSYGATPAEAVATGTAGGIALDWALAQVGTPYVWGGETPGVGFDCSGLVQAAYAAAGVSLPRVAQDQFDAGPQLPPGAPLEPGDLVFFGGGPGDVEHVGLYVGVQDGQAVMVDAPHTGADVRVEPFPTTIGASFGDEGFVGATDPAA